MFLHTGRCMHVRESTVHIYFHLESVTVVLLVFGLFLDVLRRSRVWRAT